MNAKLLKLFYIQILMIVNYSFTCDYFDKLENRDEISINNIKIRELWARCVLAKIPNIKSLII